MKTKKRLVIEMLVGAAIGVGAAIAIWSMPVERKAEAQSCVYSGYLVNTCGCWGPVEFGRSYPDGRCCSGWSTPVACPAGCSSGGYAYKVVCN